MQDERSVSLTGEWDRRISRRTLLRTGGSAAAGLLVLSTAAPATAAPRFAGDPFSLGVASGDPTPDGFVLWTRLAPAPLDGTGLGNRAYGVRYEIAKDPDFRRIVRRGAIRAVPEEVHSVHAQIAGLRPAREYWYRFKWGQRSATSGGHERHRRRRRVRPRCASRSCHARTTRRDTSRLTRPGRPGGHRARRAPGRLHLRGRRPQRRPRP